MNRQAFRQQVHGSCIPLVTPFLPDLSLDVKALRRVVRRILDAGFETGKGSLLACGAGGEFYALSTDEKKKVAETVVEEANGQIGVLVGAQDTNVLEVLDMARFCERLGATGIQVSPTYYDMPSWDDIFDMFKMISDAVDIPLMVYNSFWTGPGASVEGDQIGKLVESTNIAGLKWAAPQRYMYDHVLQEYGDKIAIIDNVCNEVVSYTMGAVGWIDSLPMLWPEYGLKLLRYLQQKQYGDALEMTSRLRVPYRTLVHKAYNMSCCESGLPKFILNALGEPVGPPRPPGRLLPKDIYEQAWQYLDDNGFPGLRERSEALEYSTPCVTV